MAFIRRYGAQTAGVVTMQTYAAIKAAVPHVLAAAYMLVTAICNLLLSKWFCNCIGQAIKAIVAVLFMTVRGLSRHANWGHAAQKAIQVGGDAHTARDILLGIFWALLHCNTGTLHGCRVLSGLFWLCVTNVCNLATSKQDLHMRRDVRCCKLQ